MATIYYDKDASLTPLKGKRVAIIGYGIQGRGQALNLRDSGIAVLVAQRPGGPNHALAKADGFAPVEVAAAARAADHLQLLTQDTLQPALYQEAIAPHLRRGKSLGFSHGFNVHFHQIVPPRDVDVFLIAPKGPGSLVRSLYVAGQGVPALLAVQQDASGKAKAVALAYARAIGATRAGVIETTFREETETDNFGEQAVLCGGVSALIKAGFETLVAAGYQPEVAYFECLHELKLIVDMIAATGISGMRRRVSETAKYGDVTRGPRIVDDRVKAEMRRILAEIQDGRFAREWIAECQANRPVYTALLQQDERHVIEQVGAKLRKMMAWMQAPERGRGVDGRDLRGRAGRATGRLAPASRPGRRRG